MHVRGSFATMSLVVCAAVGCAAPTGVDDPSTQAPAREEPLGITVDSLDVVHGSLRFGATMVDGAADVSVRLGADCDHREIGGGLSTLSTLVWTLGDEDVAGAIACGLLVRACVRDRAGSVNKVAELALAVDLAAEEGVNADDAPQVQAVTAAEAGVGVTFASVTRSARLTTGDSILEATPPAEGDPAAGDGTGRFTIPRLDSARSVLRERSLYLDGAAFTPSLSVGGTAVQSEQGSDETQGADITGEKPDETEPQEGASSDPEG